MHPKHVLRRKCVKKGGLSHLERRFKPSGSLVTVIAKPIKHHKDNLWFTFLDHLLL
jgi:hypothetical protein